MGYLHIDNLYKDTRILEFKRVYALEKIHGTSAHVRWKDGELGFFSGGEKHGRFVELFDQEELSRKFAEATQQDVVVFGEAYGGRQQGMKETYGDQLRFVAFDVKIGNSWLAVPQAAGFVAELGLEFVSYELIPSEMHYVDTQRDASSTQAERNGMGAGHKREGVVLRPPFEVTLNDGSRLIAKHKRDDFRETKTPRVVGVDPQVLADARAIAEEWVTPMRFSHIIDKLPGATSMKETPIVIRAMIEDIEREGAGEIVMTKEAKKEIGKATLALWKEHVMVIGQEERVG